ncbi:hypothetical protein AB0G82_14105 [Streptomyces anulatus]|uniref:hypothetical protein n=1 Tax=Streptomyces TaxID=1883 RepID=UPI001B398796|nr:hypothetical protein [Streptomyces sp. C3-3]MBQ1112159.1 hypothetical protein [Streptomyces sp. C3-3]
MDKKDPEIWSRNLPYSQDMAINLGADGGKGSNPVSLDDWQPPPTLSVFEVAAALSGRAAEPRPWRCRSAEARTSAPVITRSGAPCPVRGYGPAGVIMMDPRRVGG